MSPEPMDVEVKAPTPRKIESLRTITAEFVNATLVRSALRLGAYDRVFSLLNTVADQCPSTPAGDQAKVAMARMTLKKDWVDLSTYTPEQLVGDLIQLTAKGNIEARLLLQLAGCHPLFVEDFNVQKGSQVLKEASALPELSGLPLCERQRLKELYRHELSPEVTPCFGNVECEEDDRGRGDEFTIRNVDKSRPAAELILRILLRGYSYLSSTLFDSRKLPKPYCLQPVDLSVGEMVSKSDVEVKDLGRGEGGSHGLVAKVLQDVLSNDDWTEARIEEALKRLSKRMSVSDLGEDIGEFLKLSRIVSEAYGKLKAQMDADTRNRHAYDPQCRALDVLHKAKACLDYCLSPVNQHVDGSILRVLSELADSRIAARTYKRSGVEGALEFQTETIHGDTGFLGARSHYLKSIASFEEAGDIEVKPFDFKHLPDDSVSELFKTYLLAGQTDGVQQLNLEETCQLLMLANEYQVKELEALCLFIILRGIRFDLFSEEELKFITQAGPALAFTEIQEAIKPLAEDYKWEDPELRFLLNIPLGGDDEQMEAKATSRAYAFWNLGRNSRKSEGSQSISHWVRRSCRLG
ncbi:MAG: hypothetical protein ACR2PT_22270 [Endozoicomonas sp.]